MGLHPYFGYRMLGGYGVSEEVRRMVLYHHGMNPVVLQPLAEYRGAAVEDRARMLHTIDAFEALTTDRPYRRRMSVRQAAVFGGAGGVSHGCPGFPEKVCGGF